MFNIHIVFYNPRLCFLLKTYSQMKQLYSKILNKLNVKTAVACVILKGGAFFKITHAHNYMRHIFSWLRVIQTKVLHPCHPNLHQQMEVHIHTYSYIGVCGYNIYIHTWHYQPVYVVSRVQNIREHLYTVVSYNHDSFDVNNLIWAISHL